MINVNNFGNCNAVTVQNAEKFKGVNTYACIYSVYNSTDSICALPPQPIRIFSSSWTAARSPRETPSTSESTCPCQGAEPGCCPSLVTTSCTWRTVATGVTVTGGRATCTAASWWTWRTDVCLISTGETAAILDQMVEHSTVFYPDVQ